MRKFFQTVFKKEGIEDDELTTVPLSDSQFEQVSEGVLRQGPPQLVVGSARSIGRQRDHNEDSLYTLATTIAVHSTSMPFGIFIIADGMGGHKYGEIASEVAIRAMSNHLIQRLYAPIFNVTPETPRESLQEIMQNGINEAQKAVLKQAPGGGTTLTTVAILGNRMTIAHVGDSRAYGVYLDGRMPVLTRDHSFVKRLEELGQLTPEEAEYHPQRNVLIHALGQTEPFVPDIKSLPLPRPGYLFLCSDGLWGVIPETQIFRIISENAHPQRACQQLVELANAAGGPDNISVILVRMPD